MSAALIFNSSCLIIVSDSVNYRAIEFDLLTSFGFFNFLSDLLTALTIYLII